MLKGSSYSRLTLLTTGAKQSLVKEAKLRDFCQPTRLIGGENQTIEQNTSALFRELLGEYFSTLIGLKSFLVHFHYYKTHFA